MHFVSLSNLEDELKNCFPDLQNSDIKRQISNFPEIGSFSLTDEEVEKLMIWCSTLSFQNHEQYNQISEDPQVIEIQDDSDEPADGDSDKSSEKSNPLNNIKDSEVEGEEFTKIIAEAIGNFPMISDDDDWNRMNLLLRICGNILKHTSDPKYRSLSVTGPRIASLIMTNPACLHLLASLGFLEAGKRLELQADPEQDSETYQKLWLAYVMLEELLQKSDVKPISEPSTTSVRKSGSEISKSESPLSVTDGRNASREVLLAAIEKRQQLSKAGLSNAGDDPSKDIIREGRGVPKSSAKQLAMLRALQKERESNKRFGRPRSRMMTVGMLRDKEATGLSRNEVKLGLELGFAEAWKREQGQPINSFRAILDIQSDPAFVGRLALDYTNAYRQTKKLPPLAWSTSLALVGEEHSEAMAEGRRAVGHDGVKDRFARYPFRSRSSAENVGMVGGHSNPYVELLSDLVEAECISHNYLVHINSSSFL
eukprot:GHVP01034420.1.p1 GENE.GHVP01034420.1~~GHVP01034420.1.p1  ORF type:complete len:482 (-),score=95.15 GHVP01034420.1:22-1467(-)